MTHWLLECIHYMMKYGPIDKTKIYKQTIGDPIKGFWLFPTMRWNETNKRKFDKPQKSIGEMKINLPKELFTLLDNPVNNKVLW